jgi:hypothetical protein
MLSLEHSKHFETSFNALFGTFKTSLLQLGLWNIQNIEKMFWMFQTSLNPPSLPPSLLPPPSFGTFRT